MFSRLFAGDRPDAAATALYARVVEAARAPALYRDMGVPDTVAGRFEMVALHLVLVLERMRVAGEAASATGQGLFDAFCADMDRSMRELGVGDLGMGRRMRTMAESFYGRAAAYAPHLSAADAAGLAGALRRNLPAAEPAPATERLARYGLAAAAALARTPTDDMLAGAIAFPDPARRTEARAAS